MSIMFINLRCDSGLSQSGPYLIVIRAIKWYKEICCEKVSNLQRDLFYLFIFLGFRTSKTKYGILIDTEKIKF